MKNESYLAERVVLWAFIGFEELLLPFAFPPFFFPATLSTSFRFTQKSSAEVSVFRNLLSVF